MALIRAISKSEIGLNVTIGKNRSTTRLWIAVFDAAPTIYSAVRKSAKTMPSMPSLHASCSGESVRLVIEVTCSSCGPIHSSLAGWEAIEAASAHTAKTGHVVILNGTVDRPDLERPEILQ